MEADRDERDSEVCQKREGLAPLIWSDDEGIWQRDQWILMNTHSMHSMFTGGSPSETETCGVAGAAVKNEVETCFTPWG